MVDDTMCRTGWNNRATSLIISPSCYKLLTACSKLVDNLGQAVRRQLVDSLLADLLQDEIFLRVYKTLQQNSISQSRMTFQTTTTSFNTMHTP
jgi:hypothetical protein